MIKYLLALALCLSMLFFKRSNDASSKVENPNVDLAKLKENLLQMIILPLADQLPLLVEQAKRNLSALDSEKGRWPDLNYTTDVFVNWYFTEHLFRLRTMALVYSLPSAMQKDKTLKEAIHRCIRFFFRHEWQRPTWWWSRLPDLFIATEILLILGPEELSYQEVDGFVDLEYRMSRTAKLMTGHYDFIWAVTVRIYASILMSKEEELQRNFQIIWKRARIQKRLTPGLQVDFSIASSAPQFIKAALTDKWAQTMLQLILITRGTKYAPGDDVRETFARFLTEYDAWFTTGSVWNWGVLGRPKITGLKYWHPSLLPPQHIRQFANCVTTEHYVRSLRNYADRLENNRDAPALVGNQHFHIQNVHIHRRMNWIGSLKLFFNDRKDVECFSMENLRNTFIEDGVLYLSPYEAQYDGNEDYQTMFKSIGRKDIRGVRTDKYLPLVLCGKSRTVNTEIQMIGGVSDNMYGAAWMGTPIDEIAAKRSWHFYDDYIIAFGNGLVSALKNPLQTTLASLVLPAAESKEGQVTVQWSNGTQSQFSHGEFHYTSKDQRIVWFHAASTAWIILDDYESLTINCQSYANTTGRMGPWEFQMHDRILQAKVLHSKWDGQVSFSYRYVIVPNVTVASVSKIWKENNSMINDARMTSAEGKTVDSTLFIHGTCDPTLQRATAVVFRKPPRFSPDAYYNCSSLGLSLYIKQGGGILFREDADTFTVTASQPIVETRNFIIDVNRASVTSNICTRTLRWGTQGGTRLTIRMPQSEGLMGKSVSVTCKKRYTQN